MRPANMPINVLMSGAEKAWFYAQVNRYYTVTEGAGVALKNPNDDINMPQDTWSAWRERFAQVGDE